MKKHYNGFIRKTNGVEVRRKELKMTKKVSALCFLLVLIVLLTGCVDPWFKAEITSSVEEYDPGSSNMPGMPLKVIYKPDGPMPQVTSVAYVTNHGQFVSLDKDNSVVYHGRVSVLSGQTIYWIPLGENGDIAKKAIIRAVVSYMDFGVEVAKKFRATIKRDENGVYILK